MTRCRDGRRQPAPTSCGWSAASREFRTLLTVFVLQALATGAMLAGVDYVARVLLGAVGRLDDPLRLLRRPGPARDPALAAGRRGPRTSAPATSGARCSSPAARWPPLLTVRVGVAATAASVAVVGVGYAACQMFPLAMLPDVAAADTARTGESRAGTYTGVWTAGETLGLALGPLLYAGVLAAGRLRLVDRLRCRAARLGAHRHRAGLHRSSRPRSSRSPCWSFAGTGSTRRCPGDPTDDRADAPTRCSPPCAPLQALDLPAHGGRTLAYVYDSGLADADAVGLEALAMFASSNGLDPTAFPSLLRMENDLVALTGGLLDAPDGFAGSVTSGGTESILLAVLAARQGRRRPPTRAWSSRRRRTRRSTRRPSSSACARSSSTSTPTPCAPTPPPWPPPSTTRPCSSSPPPRPTPTASSTRCPRSPPWRPSAASAATSTRASAAGCCRTSTAPRRGPSPSRASPASASTCTSTPTPPRASRCCSTAPRPCAAATSSPRRTGPATRCSTARCSRPGPAGRSPRPGPSPSGSALEGYARLARAGPRGDARGRRPRSTASRACACSPPPDSTLVALVADESCDVFTDRRRDARARVVRAAADVVPRRAADPAPHAVGRHRARRCPSCVVALRGVRGRRPRRRPGGRRPGARRAAGRRSTPPPSTTQGFAGLLAAAGLAGSDGALALPRADGAGQRPARRLPAGAARGAAARRARPPVAPDRPDADASTDPSACPSPRRGIGWGGSSTAAGRTPMAPETPDPALSHTVGTGRRRRCSSRPSATTSTPRWRGCPTATRSSTARAASG